MRFPVLVGEQTGVHRRVQGLHPTIQTLGKPGQLLHSGHRHPARLDHGGGGTGRHQLHPRLLERGRQLRQPGLVVHAHQGAPDRPPTHRMVTFLPLMVQPSRTRRPTYVTSWRRSAALIRSVRVSTVSSGCTGPATCATIGPVSTPSSTKNRVAPVTLTPYASASRGAWMPGKAGRREL